ncbi:hypothetical protein [Psychroserpens sp. S379A]|uniref:HYR-like domain-containing protein n=1 Tax=Psychroserpens sp. S379A TaxID=3415137 RepID=UPI003C7CD018
MSNFTRSGSPAKLWQSITNLSCCSIDFNTKLRSSVKAIAFMMLFAFSISTINAQSLERSTFYDVCQADAPSGPSDSDVANLYLNQCGDIPVEVNRTVNMSGNDCAWTVEYAFDIKCGAFEDEIKFTYSGGDIAPPSLNDGAQVPTGASGMNLCLAQAPSGPKVTQIAGLYSDNCGEVVVQKFGSPEGTDCEWTANYKYIIMDTCGNMIDDLDINYSGGDNQAPQLNKGAQIPTGQTGLNLCYDEKPLGPTEAEIAALFSDNCGSVNVNKTLATEKGNDDCKWLSAFQYTIQDDCGNFAEPIFIEYMGGDSEDPVLSGVPANTEVSCIDEIPEPANVTATDNCKDNIQVILTENNDNLGLACEGGELIRTWTAIDDCGNMVSESQTIVVLPAPMAEFEPVSPETISCEEAFAFQAEDLLYSNGISKSACSIQGSVPGTATPNFTLCGGEIVVNWTYTDECGRTINAEKLYTVSPAPAATLDVVENFELSCADAAAYVAAPLGYSNGLEGDCGINGSVEPLQKNQFDACGGKILVDYVGEDSCGNPLNATLDITVLPAPAPVFDAIDVESELSCADASTYVAAALNYSNGLEGECNISGSVEPVQTNNFDSCGGTITITWNGQDECENPLSASVDINVLPAPEAVVSTPEFPSNIACSDAAGFDAADATYTNGGLDACEISGSLEANIVKEYDSCGGKITVTYNGEDECGRPLSAGPFDIDVDPAPEAVVSTPEFPSNIACSDAAGFDVVDATYTNGLSDACEISGSLEASIVKEYDLCGGKITVTYNGEDECGRPLSAGPFDIDVDPAPEASFDVEEHEDITCSEAANYQAGSLGYSNGIEGECGINGEVDGVLSGEFTACGGLLYVDWSYTDECGRTITARKQLKVTPAPAPTLDVVEDFNLSCSAADGYLAEPLNYSNGLDGDCNISGSLEPVQTNNFDECGGTITVTWDGEDICGNLLSASQTITVDPAPMAEFINPSPSIEVACDLADDYIVNDLDYSNGLEGTCGINGSVPGVLSGSYDACGGTLYVDWKFVDACGREIEYTKTITVLPAPAPEVTTPEFPSNIACADAANYSAANATYTNGLSGLCELSGEIEADVVKSYDACGGTITINYSGVDACQNPLSAGPYTIVVDPAPAPEVTAPQFPSNIACADAAGFMADNATYSNGLEGTACEISGEIEADVVKEYDQCGGMITITYTGKDICDNDLSAGPYTIVVDPAPAPEVTAPQFPSNIACADAAGFMADNATYSNGLEGTACEISGEIEADVVKEYDQCGGMITITYTGKDICDNDLSAGPFVIEVKPAPAPEFYPIDDDSIACEDLATYTPEYLGYSNGIDGPCGINGEVQGVAEPFDGSCGTFEVNFSYESCGVTITASQTITVIDETAPVLVGELPQGMSDVDACLSGAPAPPTEEYIEGLYSDNCGNVNATLTIVSPEENTDCLWAVLYRYTIEDDCGNFAAPVKIYHNGGDNTPPELVGDLPEGVTGLQCLSENPGEPDLAQIEAAYTDNCGDVIITPFKVFIAGDDCGWTATYEYEIKDTCGNKLPNLVIENSGADTMAPELEGEIPMGSNTVNACKDSDLGEPTEEEIAALFSDNCAELTADNVLKVEKLSIGSDCEWIRVFEYTVSDNCNNSYPTFKINYQGGDSEGPMSTGECTDEVMVLNTHEWDGLACPQAASISLVDGQEISVDTPWTVAGIPASEIGSIYGCYTDNCTAVEDLAFKVIGLVEDKGDCSTTLTVTFDVFDSCRNKSVDPLVCTFIINDTTAPVLECPADEDFGLVEETPTEFADKAAWTDNCQGSGETEVYVDSDISEDQGELVYDEGDYVFTFQAGYVLTLGGLPTGTINDYPYYSGVITDYNGNVLPSYGTFEVIYSLNDGEYKVMQDFGNGPFVAGTASADAFETCDPNAWSFDEQDGHNKAFTLECPKYSYTTNYTLVRTFIADDGCGNTSECDVTYTWSINNSDPVFRNNTYSTVVKEDKIDFKAYPVPFDNEVTISYVFGYKTDVTIELFDTKGLLVTSVTNTRYVSGATDKTKLDLTKTPSQVLYVKLTTNRGTVTKKIVSSGR